MIDQIKEVIQQFTTQEVGSNEQIPNDLAGKVASETGSSFIDGIKSAVSGGNLGDLTSLFSNADTNSLTSNPVVKNITESLGSKLNSNVGLDASAAGGFANTIVPKVISLISEKVKSGDFNISEIFASLTGGNATAALDQNGDGKLGLDDAVSALKGGKLGDTLGNLFK